MAADPIGSRQARRPTHFDQLMRPVWEGGVIHHESVTFVGDQPAPLLFDPAEVLSVRDAAQTRDYTRGRDWTLRAGRLALPPGSGIFSFRAEELVAVEAVEGTFPRIGGGHVRHAEGHYFHDRQVAVSYRCASEWTGPRPSSALPALPHTARQLGLGRLRLVVLGDSISEGYNASGFTDAPPFQPPWPNLLAEQLRRHHGAAVELTNLSVAGMDASWGRDQAARVGAALKPDLAVIAFGMNDTSSTAGFRDSIVAIQAAIRAGAGHAEFLLVATSLPNPEVILSARSQGEHGLALASLAGEGVAVADIGALHRHLLTRKRYLDLTGNNINHPNDFFHRIHAQYLSALLGASPAS